MDLGLTPERRYVSTHRPRHVRGEEAVDCLAADDLAIFRSVDRRKGSPEVDRLVARCSVACNSRSSRPPNLLASCRLQAVSCERRRGGLFPVAKQFYSSGFVSNDCRRPARFRKKREKRTTNLTSEFRFARKPVHVQEEAQHGCKRPGRLARTL